MGKICPHCKSTIVVCIEPREGKYKCEACLDIFDGEKHEMPTNQYRWVKQEDK